MFLGRIGITEGGFEKMCENICNVDMYMKSIT